MADYDFSTRVTKAGSAALLGNYVRHSKFKRAIAEYPAYSPPHPTTSHSLTIEQAQENFEYFLANKHQRVDAITTLLAQYHIHSMSVPVTTGLVLTVDAWAYQFWPAVRNKVVLSNGYKSFMLEGKNLAIRSMLFDVSVLLGELYLTLDEDAEWFTDASEESRKEDHVSLNRVVVRSLQKDLNGADIYRLYDMESNLFFHYIALKNDALDREHDKKMGYVLGSPLYDRLLSNDP